MRKLLTAAIATAALAGAATQPAAAQAGCSNWRPDTLNQVFQDNGWGFSLWYGTDRYWHAHLFKAWVDGDVMFSSWSASNVRFTVNWNNGAAGVYQGSIDSDGFVTGTAWDRWTGATTQWHMSDQAICAG